MCFHIVLNVFYIHPNGAELCTSFGNLLFKKIFIYLAVLGPCCGTQDPHRVM